jgi:hypothetical protein
LQNFLAHGGSARGDAQERSSSHGDYSTRMHMSENR